VSNTLKFQLNVPARVALSFPTGKEVEGQFGPQIMFSLCLAPAGEKLMYVPPAGESGGALKLHLS
jgi:hypothetical protein